MGNQPCCRASADASQGAEAQDPILFKDAEAMNLSEFPGEDKRAPDADIEEEKRKEAERLEKEQREAEEKARMEEEAKAKTDAEEKEQKLSEMKAKFNGIWITENADLPLFKTKIAFKNGAVVRQEVDLKSKEVKSLKKGMEVGVAEIQGTRARILTPVKGWLSTETKEGAKILESTEPGEKKENEQPMGMIQDMKITWDERFKVEGEQPCTMSDDGTQITTELEGKTLTLIFKVDGVLTSDDGAVWENKGGH